MASSEVVTGTTPGVDGGGGAGPAMGATSATAVPPTPGIGQRARWLVSDSLVITKRNLLVWYRVPAFIVFTLVQPVMFTLLFRYVFGGAIKVAGPFSYVDYLIPGVIAQTAGFTSFSTAIGLSREIQRGAVDRIRSMPSARSAFLAGRLTADVLRLTLTILTMVGVGYAVGFRFSAGPVDAVAMVALSALLGLAVCSVSAFIGLAVKDEESVQAFGLIWVFPLTFISSAFVPVQSMPSWMQGFAYNQPFTEVIDALRWLALGHNARYVVNQSLASSLWQSLAWMAGILVVFVPLATRAYKRA